MFLFILALFNLHAILFPANEQETNFRRGVLARPFEAKPHQMLGEYYLGQGVPELARQELKLAKELGANDAQIAYDEAIAKKATLRAEITRWEQEMYDKPDYRDGYLKLASLYYQLGELEAARNNLLNAREISPNHPATKKLDKLLY